MSIKSWSVILIVLGLALVAISFLADIIGVGAHPDIFGWKQIAGVAAGVVMVICGVVLLVTKRGGRAA